MNALLFAQQLPWTLQQMLIAIVIFAAACALVYIALRQFGTDIPAWVIQVFWIVICAAVVIFAIRLVFAL